MENLWKRDFRICGPSLSELSRVFHLGARCRRRRLAGHPGLMSARAFVLLFELGDGQELGSGVCLRRFIDDDNLDFYGPPLSLECVGE